MADLVIRGMEKPIDCHSCWMRVYCFERGIGVWGCGKGKPCPLVPLPEGHGDLIDRDALKKRTPMVIDYSAGGFGTDGSIRPVRGYGDWQIDQAPTIVPAEGGTDNG